ncbi:Crp/Fnr family transcriptional regulator [Pseudotabrizicola sp. 4114]|uniref:Crp/Fnr family transcriptional regulator n=1 Tax=Pseudotabrizicola sp. 4114 TaxID=2817731 RepID=UPI002855DB56|nr:CRP-like cAMP-binding protein [Pseudorhodobacter sp. 4114]
MRALDVLKLARAPPFCCLDQVQLRRVVDLARVNQAMTGSVVFDEGQTAARFFLLLAGTIRLVRMTAKGEQIIVLHVPAGQIFGTGAPLGQTLRRETALAADDCQLLSWPTALWQDFANCYAGFAAETLRAHGARADEMSDRIVELSTKMVEQRIACALLRMIAQCGLKVAGGIEIAFPISRQNIADMTGTTLHTVSRVLSAWERQGVIRSTRCHIVVTDPHQLVLTSSGAGSPLPSCAESFDATLAGTDHPVTALRRSVRKAASSNPYSSQASITV